MKPIAFERAGGTSYAVQRCGGRGRGAIMTDHRSNAFGFAAPHDAPIPYLERIRAYYAGLGYGAPYEWAHYAHVPFHRLARPLAEARLTIVTTAAPNQPGKGDQGPGAPYNAAAKYYTVYSGAAASGDCRFRLRRRCPPGVGAVKENLHRAQDHPHAQRA